MGIITLNSGLKYEILKHGNSETSPKPGQYISVNYTGWLSDETYMLGKKIDSSYDRAEPIRFAVGTGQVIKGWDEGILGMRFGEKRRLIIPPDLAYGAMGYPGIIPPDSILIFDIELLPED